MRSPAAGRSRALLTIVLAMTLLVGGVGWLQLQQWQAVERSLAINRSDISWNYHQFELEYLKLLNQLKNTLREGRRNADMAELALRYQILASRFELLQQGDAGEQLRKQTELAPVVASLGRILAALDPYLGDDPLPFDANKLARMEPLLVGQLGKVRQLVLGSSVAQNHRTTEHLHVIREQLRTTTASSSMLALLVLGFAFMTLRQLRLAHQRNDELGTLHAEMSHRATHDAMTGLSNRDEFKRRLGLRLVSLRPQQAEDGVLFIDLDRFKMVNDACGHHAGDQLLREVGQLLSQSLNPDDTLARLGGDEFGVILHEHSQQQALRVAEQLCARLDGYRFVFSGQRFRIGASVGLVMLNGRWTSAGAVLQAADSARYVAKAMGSNRVHLYRESDCDIEAYRDQMHWMQRLDSALDQDQLRLYWQRIVPLREDQLARGIKGEVLLRLQEGEQLIGPQKLLQAAERFGMSSRVDCWVIGATLDWLEQHRSALDHVAELAINLSGQSVGDKAFHRFLINELERRHLPAGKLVFEITETAAIADIDASRTLIKTLQGLGVKVALDDFGSGMSSFGYLKNLPVDYLKIDSQFIRELAHDAYDQVAVQAICNVAKVTGKLTIAEGIEDATVEALLRDYAVDFGQGYHWHQPEPLDALLQAGVAAEPARPRLGHQEPGSGRIRP
ncbi:putative bifunctional diguanylate cyclase/phosphodiesterase [Malikia spinosa]|uniref:EAL domain-containing protein n=1 Tax=Malikia spinosa TaxID=86180 RepID=A0A7C9JA17_9BURK|nr:EAL domain-containing protein [Malikia spinosa]MYZ53530.1 EAL domain-containing protein [Malikia spinosa]